MPKIIFALDWLEKGHIFFTYAHYYCLGMVYEHIYIYTTRCPKKPAFSTTNSGTKYILDSLFIWFNTHD